jgi:hypothetical protein
LIASRLPLYGMFQAPEVSRFYHRKVRLWEVWCKLIGKQTHFQGLT